MAVSDDVAAGELRTVGRAKENRWDRPVPRVPVESRSHLRTLLITVDAVALGLAWGITLVPWPYSGRPELQSVGVAALLTVVGLWIIHLNGLYLARNATMRTMEMARIGRSAPSSSRSCRCSTRSRPQSGRSSPSSGSGCRR